MKRSALLIFCICCIQFLYAQNIAHVCPPNWWTGMENNNLQLMIHGQEISSYHLTINYPGVDVFGITKVENPNYIFVDLVIGDDTKPGMLNMEFTLGKKKFTTAYELKQREQRTFNYGLDASDFIYLLMPDRFANGDTSNDVVSSMNETIVDRMNPKGRHGGDIKGIINHLDYIKNLGATAIWSTPLIENNQPLWSYHGYAATDHYKIDARYGDNVMYQTFVDAAHQRDLKVVVDLVHNHVGNEHWFIQDLPMQDWIHQWDEGFVRSNYRTSVKLDPYASTYDHKKMNEGWFDKHMPDLNQDNPFLTNYLIQNNIWWVEMYHVDGFRLDTYPYSDLDFLVQWKKAIDTEYPDFGIFGEVWVNGVGVQGYFHGDNHMKTDFNSLLPGVTDFNLYDALQIGLNENFGWYDGVTRIYHNLAQDYLYGDVMKNVLFLSNHDISRFYSVMHEDVAKFKMAIAFIMTTRGMVQWYYGDEIGMKNYVSPEDGKVREDFPGGWAHDPVNKFDQSKLSAAEKELSVYVTTLANWRKNSEAIQSGKLMQFIPENGIYVYFRYTGNSTVMVVMNATATPYQLDTKRFAERLSGYTTAKNVVTSDASSLSQLNVSGMGCNIYELGK